MSATTTFTGTLVAISCGKCGIHFGLDKAHRQALKAEHATFYCPNGHARWYPPPGETEEEKLQARLERQQRRASRLVARLDQAEAEAAHNAARANGYKGALTKVKKRLGAGMCPCCSAEFKDVAAHMRRMHPEHVDP